MAWTYTSATGLFSCTFPAGVNASLDDGVVMFDSDAGYVRSMDDLGTLYRVEYSRFSSKDRSTLHGDHRDAFLKDLFDGMVMNSLRSASTSVTVIHRERVAVDGRSAYLAVVNIPHGSTASWISGPDFPYGRPDDLRTILLSTTPDDWLLVSMHSAPNGKLVNDPASALRARDEKITVLSKSLLSFAGTIRIKPK